MKVHCPRCGEEFTVRPPIMKTWTNGQGYLTVEFGSVIIDHLCEQPQDR
jgi:hypothetical protein